MPLDLEVAHIHIGPSHETVQEQSRMLNRQLARLKVRESDIRAVTERMRTLQAN